MKDRHKSFFNRIISIFVTLTLCLGLLQIPVFAAAKWHTVTLVPTSTSSYASKITSAKVKVGDKVGKGNYEVTSVSGTTIKVKAWGNLYGDFFLPLASQLWNGAAKSDYVSWAGTGSSQRTEGGSAMLPQGDASAYYYFNTAGSVSGGGTSSNVWNFTLHYDANLGSGAPGDQTYGTADKYEKSHTFTLSGTKPTRSGYTFKGWADSKSATSANYQPNGSCFVSQTASGYTGGSVTKTIYAVWEEISQNYKVTYYDRGSQCAQDTYKQGADATVRSCPNTRDGYTFLGWSTSSNATVADWVAGDEFTVNSNVNLYAVWQKKPNVKASYTVEWYLVDDTKPGSAQTPLKAPETREDVVGATVSATNTDKTIGGYTYLASVSTESATLATSGTVLKLLFRRTEPTKATMTVVKTFEGLTRSQVPTNYLLVMKSLAGNVVKTLSLSDAAVSNDGLTYTWTLRDMATESWGNYTTVGGSYSHWNGCSYVFSESNYAVPDYAVTVTAAATGASATLSPTPERIMISFRKTDVTSAKVEITNTYTESVDWTVEWFKGYDVKTFEDIFSTGTLVKDTTPIKSMTLQGGKGTAPTVADSVYPGKDGKSYPELSPSDQQYTRKHVGWAQPVVDEVNRVIKIKALWETTATENVTSYKKYFHVVDANGKNLGYIPENLISKDFQIDMVVTDSVTNKTLHTQTFNKANGSLDGVYNDTVYYWQYRFDYIVEHGYSMVKTESNYEIAGYTHVGSDRMTKTVPAKETPVLEIHDNSWGTSGSISTTSWINEYTKNTVTVTWKDGYTDTPIKTVTIDEGGDYSGLYPTADPTREGYDFIGWSNPETDADGNITITAQWKVHVHDFNQTKAPTCTEDGEEECSCGETRPIEALGHDWGEWTVKTPATCTEDGVEERVCKRDPSHVETRPIEALGHDWGEWTVKTPATCTENGVEERVCGRDHSHVETRPIEALGHDWGEWKDNGDGTHSQVCKRDESHIKTDKDPHHFGEWTTSKEPTETEPGEEEHVCEDCGHKETKPIPAKGSEEDPNEDVTVKATDTDGTDPGTWTDGTKGEKDLPSDEDGKVKVPTSDDITPPDGKELDKWIDQDGNEYTPGEEIEPDKDLILTPVWKDKDEEITDIPDDNPPLAEPDEDDNTDQPDDSLDDILDDDVPLDGPDTPKTGDNSAAPMALLVLVFSGACLVWALSSKKRRTFSK